MLLRIVTQLKNIIKFGFLTLKKPAWVALKPNTKVPQEEVYGLTLKVNLNEMNKIISGLVLPEPSVDFTDGMGIAPCARFSKNAFCKALK